MKVAATKATSPSKESDNMKAKKKQPWAKTLKRNNIIHLVKPRARPTKSQEMMILTGQGSSL
jgi:hypothetical protein